MAYLVTDGAGFIGSNYVRHLLRKGKKVIVLDAFTYTGNLENLKEDITEENLPMPGKCTYLSTLRINTKNF